MMSIITGILGLDRGCFFQRYGITVKSEVWGEASPFPVVFGNLLAECPAWQPGYFRDGNRIILYPPSSISGDLFIPSSPNVTLVCYRISNSKVPLIVR